MLIYRYTLVLVQYIIPVCVISFVYIQVNMIDDEFVKTETRDFLLLPFRWPLSFGAAKLPVMHKVFQIIFFHFPFSICHFFSSLFTQKPLSLFTDVRDINLLKNKKKVIKMLVIVVVLFCVAWFPLQLYNILQVTWPEVNEYPHINIIWLCFDWLAMSNSCYNPFIYGIYNVSLTHRSMLKGSG